jgi:hypothetical protein
VSLQNDLSVSRQMLKLLFALARCLIKDDASAWAYVVKNVSLLREPKIISTFVPEDNTPVEIGGVSAKTASKQMATVYQKLTGKLPVNGYFISPLSIKALREKSPEDWSKYAALSKILNNEVKRLVFRFVRSKGKLMVPIDAVSKYLDAQGILNNLPRGFVGGQVDENMKFYTAEGRQLDKSPAGVVRMNPKYDPALDNTYVLYAEGYGKRSNGGDVGAGRIRTVTFLANNKNKRHAAVSQFIEDETTFRNKWVKDLDRKGTKEQILAVMTELLYDTAARIGNKGNKSNGEPTYGLTTLMAKNVSISGNYLKFNYVGKKNAAQDAKYNLTTAVGKKVKPIIQKLLADAEPNDLLFTFRGRPIIRHAVNLYIHGLGIKMSAHGFRRLAGTKLAMELIAKNPFTRRSKTTPVKESQVNKWIKDEMKKVGEVLHHRNGENVTGMTAIKSYIAPNVLADFYESLGLRVPDFVPTGAKE